VYTGPCEGSNKRRQRIGEVLVLAAAEAMAAHHNTAAEEIVGGIAHRKLGAFVGGEYAVDGGTAVCIEVCTNLLPAQRGDPHDNYDNRRHVAGLKITNH